MRSIRCCVIDDEPLALALIKDYVEKTPFLQLVNAFPSASSAIKTIIEEDIDLVFLDIQMSELNGTEFARVVPPHCRVIFVTAFDKYALEAFRVNALDYLLKPVNYSEFMEAANKALRWFVMEERANAQGDVEDCIIVKSEYKLVQIPIDDILYIEGLKDYVKIYLEGAGGCIMSLGVAVIAFYACAPFIYRADVKSEDDRTQQNSVWETVYSDFGYVQECV